MIQGHGCRIEGLVEERAEVWIGDFVHIAPLAHVGIGGGRTTIEDYAAVASGGKVISGANRYEAPSMSECAPDGLRKTVDYVTRIGRFAVVQTNAVVLPGISLGEGAVLAAGSVASKDIPEWEVWGGVPAKFIKKRAIERRFFGVAALGLVAK